MSEQIKEVLQMRGINIRNEAADIEDPETRSILNFDPFQKPGALVIRRGKVYVRGPLDITGSSIRALAKVNAKLYEVAGRMVYRESTAIAAELAANLQTSITSFRPLNDSVTWAFFADDDLMFKDDTSRTYVWGIDEPLAPGPKVANQTGKEAGDTITAGVYGIAVTQLRYDLSGDINFESNG